jgi:hypothetical protein
MELSIKQVIKRIVLIFGMVILGISPFWIWESVGAGEIVVVQFPNGALEVYNTPGIKLQFFGRVTRYPKNFSYEFYADKDRGSDNDESIRVRFNDGGHANISGSCRITLPQDKPSMIAVHVNYNSFEGIQTKLIRPVLEKSVYMTGPLMSSKESSSTKRNDLLTYISDQSEFGVYKTRQKEARVKEDGSDSSKIVTIVEILKNTNGDVARQEISPFKLNSIGFSNLSIKNIEYDSAVEKQIRSQQELAMQVQTAMARAKTAEQQVFTTQKEGEATAAKAKWDQEAIKAQKVTEAEQELAVQQLQEKKSLSYKQQQINEGEGEAAKKRLIMNANGALDVKLDAWVKSQQYMWDAFAKHTGNMVPMYQSGGGVQSNAMQYMEMMGMKAAKDLGLDMSNKK